VSLGKSVCLLLALVFAVAAGDAGGGALTPSTRVVIEVLGPGIVTGPGVSCGRGAGACYGTFSSTGAVTLIAGGAAQGWSFSGWGDTGDTDCAGTSTAGCSVPLDGGSHQITATFATTVSWPTRTLAVGVPNNTGGKVTGGRINCGSGAGTSCGAEVFSGSTLTVVQAPDAGFLFTGWGGSCSAVAPTCTVEMTEDRNVAASFSVASTARTLTATVAGNGSVSGGGINCASGSTCSGAETAGAFITLTAAPQPNSTFVGWTGDCTGTAATCVVQMTADRRITATFATTFTLSVSVTGGGTVTGSGINCSAGGGTCSAALIAGTPVTLSETPASGATFNGWGGACTGTSTTCTLTIGSATSVSATFTSPSQTQTYPLSVSVTGSGTVSGARINCGLGGSACSASLAPSTNVTLTGTPAAGASFLGWGGACSGTSTTCSFTMTAAATVSASFSTAPATHRLSVTVRGPGRVVGGSIQCGNGFKTCAANEAANATVTLTATPKAGARFRGWGGACSGSARTCRVQMIAARTVSATFAAAAAKATLTLIVDGRGILSAPGGRCVGAGATVTCQQAYPAGRRVTLRATPRARASFRGWGGGCAGTRTTCTLLLAAGRSVTATFSG
jgi:uncharacterized repeat protein (TIGR02543 family)